jgi:hypothetical protein
MRSASEQQAHAKSTKQRASIRARSEYVVGLWSMLSSMGRPRRQSTARQSPTLAMKRRRPSSSTTSAVVPHVKASPPTRSASSTDASPARWGKAAQQARCVSAGELAGERRRAATAALLGREPV